MPLVSEFFEHKNRTGKRSGNSSKLWTTLTQPFCKDQRELFHKCPFKKGFLKKLNPFFQVEMKFLNLTVKLRQILKRSLKVCFDFDGSCILRWSVICKLLYSPAVTLWIYPTAKVSKGRFSKSWGLRASVSFSRLPTPPRCFHQCCVRPNFCAGKMRKTPRTGGKPYGNARYAG